MLRYLANLPCELLGKHPDAIKKKVSTHNHIVVLRPARRYRTYSNYILPCAGVLAGLIWVKKPPPLLVTSEYHHHNVYIRTTKLGCNPGHRKRQTTSSCGEPEMKTGRIAESHGPPFWQSTCAHQGTNCRSVGLLVCLDLVQRLCLLS